MLESVVCNLCNHRMYWDDCKFLSLENVVILFSGICFERHKYHAHLIHWDVYCIYFYSSFLRKINFSQEQAIQKLQHNNLIPLKLLSKEFQEYRILFPELELTSVGIFFLRICICFPKSVNFFFFHMDIDSELAFFISNMAKFSHRKNCNTGIWNSSLWTCSLNCSFKLL